MAVLCYYRRKIFDMISGTVKSAVQWKSNTEIQLVGKLLVATLPIVIFGSLILDMLLSQLREVVPVAIATLCFGALLGGADAFHRKYHQEERDDVVDLTAVSYPKALWIGFAQLFAVIPGTSRSGVTITAGLFVGLNRLTASNFSFLLAIPAILASSVLVLLHVLESGSVVVWHQLFIAVVVSFVIAYATIDVFLRVVNTTGLIPFAVYRILLGASLLIFL